MSTATITDPIAAADQAIAQAEADLASVHERLKAGADVTAAEMGEAEMRVRLAQTRRGFAVESVAEQRECARLNRIEQIRRDLPEQLDDARLEPARAALAEALDAWFGVCAEHDRTLGDAWNALSAEAPNSTPGVRLNDGGVHGSVVIGTTVYRNAPALRTVAAGALAAFRAHYPRRWFSLDNPQE